MEDAAALAESLPGAQSLERCLRRTLLRRVRHTLELRGLPDPFRARSALRAKTLRAAGASAGLPRIARALRAGRVARFAGSADSSLRGGFRNDAAAARRDCGAHGGSTQAARAPSLERRGSAIADRKCLPLDRLRRLARCAERARESRGHRRGSAARRRSLRPRGRGHNRGDAPGAVPRRGARDRVAARARRHRGDVRTSAQPRAAASRGERLSRARRRCRRRAATAAFRRAGVRGHGRTRRAHVVSGRGDAAAALRAGSARPFRGARPVDWFADGAGLGARAGTPWRCRGGRFPGGTRRSLFRRCADRLYARPLPRRSRFDGAPVAAVVAAAALEAVARGQRRCGRLCVRRANQLARTDSAAARAEAAADAHHRRRDRQFAPDAACRAQPSQRRSPAWGARTVDPSPRLADRSALRAASPERAAQALARSARKSDRGAIAISSRVSRGARGDFRRRGARAADACRERALRRSRPRERRHAIRDAPRTRREGGEHGAFFDPRATRRRDAPRFVEDGTRVVARIAGLRVGRALARRAGAGPRGHPVPGRELCRCACRLAAAVELLPGPESVTRLQPPGSQRGIALILVLWLTVLLTVIASAFAYSMHTEAVAARNAVSLAQARALADGAIMRMAFELMRPRTMNETWQADGVPHYWDEGDAHLAVNAIDESGKIDLNSASDALLKGLFQTAGGLDADAAQGIVDRIDDWKDADELKRPNGAEAPDYKAAGLLYAPANAPFESVAELQRILGMTASLYGTVADHLTVFSKSPGVNPAFASRTVLLAIPGATVEAVDTYLAQRQDALAQG